jgi:hypothetical protein
VRLEVLGQLKNLIRNRTRDLPACSTVPQPTTLLRASFMIWCLINQNRNLTSPNIRFITVSEEPATGPSPGPDVTILIVRNFFFILIVFEGYQCADPV